MNGAFRLGFHEKRRATILNGVFSLGFCEKRRMKIVARRYALALRFFEPLYELWRHLSTKKD